MDNLEKTIVLDSSDEDSTLILDSTKGICCCSKCQSKNSSPTTSTYLTACSQLDLSFVDFSANSFKNEFLKRSISNNSFDQGENKKSKTTMLTSSQISNEYTFSKKMVSSEQIWVEDKRLSKIYYYNRIDDLDFDIEIFISSILERLIDISVIGKAKYTIEHYFHLEKKKQLVEKNMKLCSEISEKLNCFIKDNEENKTDLIWNEIHKQTAKRRLEDQIQIKKISEEDFSSFSEFLDEIYEKFELLD